MDTSNEYIKMCAKAREIHELSNKYSDVHSFYVEHHAEAYKHIHTNEFDGVWLPRQDQLQDMLVGDGSNGSYCTPVSPQGNTHYKYGFADIVLTRCLLNKFHQWCNEYDYYVKFRYLKPLNIFNSMEQLWLAFVILEKYNKFWDGKDWLKVV